jgi:hypothetical protein
MREKPKTRLMDWSAHLFEVLPSGTVAVGKLNIPLERSR